MSTDPDAPAEDGTRPGVDIHVDEAARAMADNHGYDYYRASGEIQAAWREQAQVAADARQGSRRQTAEESVSPADQERLRLRASLASIAVAAGLAESATPEEVRGAVERQRADLAEVSADLVGAAKAYNQGTVSLLAERDTARRALDEAKAEVAGLRAALKSIRSLVGAYATNSTPETVEAVELLVEKYTIRRENNDRNVETIRRLEAQLARLRRDGCFPAPSAAQMTTFTAPRITADMMKPPHRPDPGGGQVNGREREAEQPPGFEGCRRCACGARVLMPGISKAEHEGVTHRVGYLCHEGDQDSPDLCYLPAGSAEALCRDCDQIIERCPACHPECGFTCVIPAADHHGPHFDLAGGYWDEHGQVDVQQIRRALEIAMSGLRADATPGVRLSARSVVSHMLATAQSGEAPPSDTAPAEPGEEYNDGS